MDAIPITFHLSADEVAYVEACLSRRRELLAVCDEAPYGPVLARCEAAASEIVRQQGRELVAEAITRRVAVAEKKGRRSAGAGAAGCGRAGVRTNGPS